MTDSVDVIDITDPTDSAAVESAIQSWLDNNAVTSVDLIDYEQVAKQRAQVLIFYTS